MQKSASRDGHFEYKYVYMQYLKQIKEYHVYVCAAEKNLHQNRGIWYWINIHWEFVEFMNLIEISSDVQYIYNTYT